VIPADGPSLGAAEFMAAVTDMREPRLLLNYCGHLGKVTDASNTVSQPDCPRMSGGKREVADVERYLKT
jgi:hypothetical protein